MAKRKFEFRLNDVPPLVGTLAEIGRFGYVVENAIVSKAKDFVRDISTLPYESAATGSIGFIAGPVLRELGKGLKQQLLTREGFWEVARIGGFATAFYAGLC